MLEDGKDVQPKGDVIATPSVEPEKSTPEPVQPQLSPEESLKQKIGEAVKDAVGKTITEATQRATREIQSIKDKSRKEIEALARRASVAETTLSGVLPELDEDARTKIELARLRGQAAVYQTKESEEDARRQNEEFYGTFTANMTEFITESGIDPNDKRIDWAKDAKDGFEMQKRIHSSVAKIQKDDRKVADEKRSQEIKDLETKLRKDLGLDSVDTSNPVSAPKKDVNKMTASELIKEGLKEGQKKK